MKEEIRKIMLQAKDLSIGYKNKKNITCIAENINLSLHKGSMVCLLGKNGIGKSTLLRTLAKIQNKLSGTMELNEQALENYSNIDLAKTLSLVLTEAVSSKNLTIYELVALGRQPYTNWVGNLSEVDKDIVNRAISQTNISDLKDKKCFELSDGQLQKAMIARALAQDTAVIILDEPTTHLDMYHKAYILKLLQKLVKETGKTILFSSHEIDLAIQLCDKMVVLTPKGVVSDTPSNLIARGTFNDLFPKDLIAFDEITGSFRVKK